MFPHGTSSESLAPGWTQKQNKQCSSNFFHPDLVKFHVLHRAPIGHHCTLTSGFCVVFLSGT